MLIFMQIDKILKPYKKYDKDFYPVSVKDIKGKNGNYIFNCLVPIPEKTKVLQAELYNYQGTFKIKNVIPFKDPTDI